MNEIPSATVSVAYQRLDPRHKQLGLILGLIFALVVTIGMMTGLTIFTVVRFEFDLIWTLVCALAAVLSMLLFVSAIVMPGLEYRHASWRLDETGLHIRRGVWWRHQIIIPFARVQHADVSQGPFQRYFELATLTVHTAGTQNASIELDGLSHVDAVELRDRIIAQQEGHDAV